jgi:hypothetical protein
MLCTVGLLLEPLPDERQLSSGPIATAEGWADRFLGTDLQACPWRLRQVKLAPLEHRQAADAGWLQSELKQRPLRIILPVRGDECALSAISTGLAGSVVP